MLHCQYFTLSKGAYQSDLVPERSWASATTSRSWAGPFKLLCSTSCIWRLSGCSRISSLCKKSSVTTCSFVTETVILILLLLCTKGVFTYKRGATTGYSAIARVDLLPDSLLSVLGYFLLRATRPPLLVPVLFRIRDCQISTCRPYISCLSGRIQPYPLAGFHLVRPYPLAGYGLCEWSPWS